MEADFTKLRVGVRRLGAGHTWYWMQRHENMFYFVRCRTQTFYMIFYFYHELKTVLYYIIQKLYVSKTIFYATKLLK